MHAFRVTISIDENCGGDGPHPSQEVIISGYGVRVRKDLRDQPITDHARNREQSATKDHSASREPNRMSGVCVLFPCLHAKRLSSPVRADASYPPDGPIRRTVSLSRSPTSERLRAE